jgi:4-amino-4-deoxychorismate lyase
MYPLLETIRLENGKLMNLAYHEKRMDRSLGLLFGKRHIPPINEIIKVTEQYEAGLFKCRLLYSYDKFKLKIESYRKRQISHLLLIEKPEIRYDLKYSNRSVFEALINPDEKNTEVLVTQSKYLTDTSYTNIALKRGDNWFTPAVPMLKGTQRALLLDAGLIQIGEIKEENLNNYSKIRLFNSMMPWDNCIELDVSQIRRNE